MERVLRVSVRLHDGRFHGLGEWPPSPGRLFQALVAGVGLTGPLEPHDREALAWLETLSAPVVGAPKATKAQQAVTMFVPNNDLDSVGGDPRRLPEIRGATKIVRPHLFDAEVPFVYAWSMPDSANSAHVTTLAFISERVYQFGRGIDLAWAWTDVLEREDFEQWAASYPGDIHRPSTGPGKLELATPMRGSLESLERRYSASARRHRKELRGRSVSSTLSLPPKAAFRRQAYDSPAVRLVFEIRELPDAEGFGAVPLGRAVALVAAVRDGAVSKLVQAMPARQAEMERALVGRKPDGSNGIAPSARVRFIPLPSMLGHQHADSGIRRILVEIPPSCPVAARDVEWALSGLGLSQEFDERGLVLTRAERADAERWSARFGIDGSPRRRWRTVTPVALPEGARRRRIDPARRANEAKDGAERASEIARAAHAILQALRHAGLPTTVEEIRVQREPLHSAGLRAEAFAEGTRFDKDRLLHLELTFLEPVEGPIVLGDGRFLGLGVMAPTGGSENHGPSGEAPAETGGNDFSAQARPPE